MQEVLYCNSFRYVGFYHAVCLYNTIIGSEELCLSREIKEMAFCGFGNALHCRHPESFDMELFERLVKRMEYLLKPAFSNGIDASFLIAQSLQYPN